MESAALEKSAPATRRLMRFDPAAALDIGPDDFVFDAPGVEAVAAECAGVVLVDGDETRAMTLLAAGASCVFIGETALKDSGAIGRLVAARGDACVGIYAPVKRQAVSWSFETTSNADFKTVAPSLGEPGWELLLADGTPTGALAPWWLGAMRELGARQFLLRADLRDDADLNICAGLVETFGEALWLAPLDDPRPPPAEWLALAGCRQVALPTAAQPCAAQLEAA